MEEYKISANDFELTFLIIAIFLALIKLIHLGSRKLSMPDVLGELTLGFILGPTLLGVFYLSKTPSSSLSRFLDISSEQLEITYIIVKFIAEFAVLLLLFKVGTEIDLSLLQKYRKSIFSSAIGGVIIPFIAGFSFVLLIFYVFNVQVAFSDLGVNDVALFIGVAMTATSIGITLRVFMDMNLIRSKISQIVVGAAVIDDILSVTLLGLIITYLDNTSAFNSNGIIVILMNITLFFIISFLLFKYVIPRVLQSSKKVDDPSVQIFISIAFMLSMAVFAQYLHLTPIIGAFVAGAIIGNEPDFLDFHKDMEPISSWIIPFFFLTIGLSIDAKSLMTFQTILLAFILMVFSVGSKLFGGMIGAKLSGMPTKDSTLVGLSMAARGEVTLIFIATAFTSGFISEILYGIALLSVVFTIIVIVPTMKIAFSKWISPNQEEISRDTDSTGNTSNADGSDSTANAGETGEFPVPA